METRKSTRCITRHDTQSNWESANPVLLDGEEILVECSDGITRRKVGDGVSAYSALPFSDFGFANIDLSNITIDGMENKIDKVVTASSTDGKTYTATVDGLSELYVGLRLTIIPDINSASTTPTLNVNGLGAYNIQCLIDGYYTGYYTSGPYTSWLRASKPVVVFWTGSVWVTDFSRPYVGYALGTLPVSKGGTGRTSAPSMLVNLASTSTASPFSSSPRPGVTGVLPIANGGTGASTAADALAALGAASADHTHDTSEDIGRILKDGLTDGQKTISSDGTVITTVASDGRTLVKTFTNEFLTITSILTDANGNTLGQMVREISSDGTTINTTITK